MNYQTLSASRDNTKVWIWGRPCEHERIRKGTSGVRRLAAYAWETWTRRPGNELVQYGHSLTASDEYNSNSRFSPVHDF
jgi:hypothetical protein